MPENNQAAIMELVWEEFAIVIMVGQEILANIKMVIYSFFCYENNKENKS